MTNNLKVKRINRENGEEDFVTLKYAVEKITASSFTRPDNSDRTQTRNILKQGSRMQTVSYLYEINTGMVANS